MVARKRLVLTGNKIGNKHIYIMAERPLYTLYKNLKAQNYDVPDDYDKFESALTRDGKGGADNRHAIYENLKAQNFDVPNTYERFYSALFEPRSKTSSRAKGGSIPMTAADRARFSAGAQAISASAQQTMNNAGRYNRLKQRKQKQQKDFGRVNLGTHQTPYGGDANNVVKDDFAYNPETGKAGAYLTSDSENAYTQNDAEQKQNLLDKYGEEWNNAVDMGVVPSELDKADPDLSDTDVAMRQMERRQEWLNENQDRRSKELNESMHLQGSPFVASGGAVAPSSFNTAISNEANRLSDVEYGAYNTAKAYNQMLRTTLLQELKEQKQRNENAGWWKDKWNDVSNYFGAMFNTMLDPKLYSQGVMDAAISNNLLQVKKGMEDGTIKKGSNAGNAAQAMLGAIQQQQAEAAKQQQYGTKAYQYGDMSGRSLKFMGDFALSGWRNVMTTGFTKAGEKVGEKMALGALGKWFTKNTGRVLGDIAGSAALAATNQLGSTYNNVIERYVGMNNENGGVTQDKNGDLKFNEGVSLGKAIKDGFGSATIENFSEMFGEYLPGASKLLSKLGLSKVSSFFEKIGNNAYYKWLSNATNKSGIQGVMAEISEEEFGTALHAAWGDGDGSWSDFNVFTNPDAREKQIDTCLGMFYSVGFMQAPRTAVGAINAVQYFNIKHQVSKADKFGQMMFTDKWDEIKSKIDVTTNADLTKTVLDATRSDSMTAKQKGAVINYAMFLSKLRGFNQASDAKTKDKVEEGDTAPTLSNDLDDAYTEGHNADDTDKHNIQLEQNDKANELAAMLHITPEQLHDMADEDLEAMTGQDDKLDQAIYDYQVSTAKYQGVMDGAQDEVDMAAHQAAMETDNMTDLSRGTVRKATIKATGGAEDYEVYIISGNIATHDDGSIDVGNSDDMIIYYDPTTGRKEHADAMMFADLIEELPAADVKAQAINDAKENVIKKIAGIVDGTVDVGSQFSVTDADGTEHTYEVLADNGDGTAMITIDGNVPTELVKGENVQIPYSFADLQQLKDAEDLKRLEAAKAQREQMEKERAEQQMQAQTTQAENPAQESNIQSAPIEDNLKYSDILRKDGKVQMVDVSDKDGNNLFPDAKDVFYIQGNKMRTKFAYIDANGELKTQSFPTGLVKIKTRGEVSVDDYKKYRSMILSAESSAMPESSMIEENSGSIEADRGGIEVDDNTQPLSEADADNVISLMESSAEVAPELELTPDNWAAEFGEDGIVSTPIGDVKMGENQVAKLFEKGRSKEFGMIKPTLTNPDVIIEVPSHSADGNEERSSSYLFIKTFLGKNGEKVYYFKSVTIKKDGLEISISSHYDRAKRVKEALMKGKLLYRKNDGAQTEQNQPSTSVTTSQEDAAGSSESKDTNISANGNENNESLTFEDGTPIPVDENGETDLSQTDAAHAAEWYDNNLGEDADDWLDGEIKKDKKLLEQAKNKKLTGNKPSELVASKKEKEAAIAKAQAVYNSAISIRDALKERRITKEENTPEGRKNLIEKARRKFARLKSGVNNDAEAVAQLYKETVGTLLHRLYDVTGIDVTDTIPLTAEEYVASNLGAHSLNYEGTETSKGVKQETGLSREDFAKTQLLAADGKGTTIDDLVHSLWENRPSNLESLNTQDIRNALIGVLTSGFKASEARNYIENLRIAQAENFLEEQKKAADNAAFAEEQTTPAEQQTETAPESEEKTEEENSDEINDEENEKINEQTNENINAPEQNKFPDKLKEGSKTIEVPEDATDDAPLGKPLDESDLRFSSKGNDTQQTTIDSDADVEKNKVDDVKVVDNIVSKKTRKTLEKIAKIMGANIQWLYSNKQFNGKFDEKTNTIYLTLDSSIIEGVQFIFGHEMTHEMRTKNPAAYDELKTLVKDMMGEDIFSAETDKMQQRYKNGGARYWNNRNAIEEEVVADQLGVWIRDANYAHTLLLKMSHPLLARLHEIVNRFLMALHGIEISDDMNLILRSIEQAYVKSGGKEGEIFNGHRFSLKVYHGSGADFTEFDFDHMGEGAGSQTFGWGGYVTSSKKIGKDYAMLKDNPNSNLKSDAKEFLKSYPTYESFLANHKRIGASQRFTESEKKNFYEGMVKAANMSRNLYEVDIPEDNGSNYLDWDAPITDELIDKVAKALPSLRSFDIKDLKKDRTFGNLYKTISMRSVTDDATFNDDKAASKLLSSLGYTGIKYKAGRNFGGAEEGDTNYVIFKPEDMKITEHTKFSLKDNQGNPLNQDGTLKLDKIKSVDELTDEDFLHPTRNVELPKLPKKIADAIGTEGKPVVIKKNIFERNYMRHKDVTPELSKTIFKSALYNPDLYGQNQKKTRPYNWVLINTKDEKGNNRTVLLEVNPNKDNVEIVHWHFVNDKNLGLIKKQAIREGDQVLILPSEKSEEVGGLSNLTDDLSAAKIDNSSETAKENSEKFSLKDEKIKSVAEKFGVNEDDVAMYANAIEKGSTAEAARARANIKRHLLQANEDKITSFKELIKYTKPVNEALKENFGDLDAMIEERRKQVEAERNAMEAARKRAQEEEEKRQKHLEELSLIPTDELDKRYMDAIANKDESTAREMLDESARRKGYDDADSDYQGQGAWAAPSNPKYGSDEERRADIDNAPDVNLEDVALGYSLQPDDYFSHPERYSQNTPHGLESVKAINTAIDAIKNGEKDVKVRVYRAVPTSVKEGKLRNGDWVTPSKKYAEMHGDHRLEGKYRIIEDEVPANQLWWDGNDANEFGFDDGKEYRYKNAKNNRKLNDLITYDNKGNVIPPSKRFNSRKSDIRFSLAGERGAAAADKADERTFRMDNLSVARKMEEEKKDAKAIKMATGWERGADGKWRYEMPDAMIKDTMDVGGGHIVKRYEDDMLWNGGKLSDVIDAPELFKAYPHLKDVRIETDAIMNDMPSNGEYNAKTNTITIHADELKYMNSILNHEIQHAIQSIEGFDRGGSPRLVRGEIKKRLAEVTKQIRQLRAEGKEDEAKAIVEKNRGLYNAYQANDDYNSYKSLAGEVEARNVQERMNMTPEERRKTLAESTEDVARKDQIFLGVGDVSFSLRGSTPYDKQMEEWKEKNHLDKDAAPMEKPIKQDDENIFDYMNRMVEWTRNQNLWKTAPKQTGFQDALDKWKADNGLSPDAYPPVRPHREYYSSEIGYAEDLEEYNKKKELWKSAPKPKDFDLSVDLEDMNKQLRNIRRAVLNQKNYDQRTVKAVSDLVRKMLNIGWGDGLSRGKVGNLLSAAKNATGVNDVKKYLDKAMGILAENYLNRLTTAYDNLINTKGARADQSGVIKMGSLDAKGQAFMSEYKKAINMDDKSLNTYIANIEEDSAKNEDNVEMNDYRLAGIQAAIIFKQQIGGNDADIAELQRQIGELKNKKNATKEDKDLLKSLEKKLFENKFDRITMYENLLNNIQRMVKESKGRAKEFREEIAEHKNEILHRANLDLEGVDSTYYDTTTAKKKLVNNDLQRAVFSSTYTFEQFLKFFGKKAANGEGYLYNYFTKLNQDALDEEQLYNEMNRNALDEKTKELFGKKKFMKLVGIDGNGMKEMDIEVTDYSNKETGKRTIHLKQGQMLYIYLVNKETDGEMKLRAMGITEEDVAAIEANLDPRVKAMGEWLQDEYLPECQRRYQATHTKYFGAPMKEVENYFPLAINNRARNVKEDVNQDSDAMSQLAGTSTGAIVTRRVNVIPLDIENADAFEVAFNHLQEMEEWSAMLPFRQDINTLLSYTHFRNQVQNMSSVAYGSGKTLWDEFKQTAQIAAGTYKPKVNAGMMDSRIAAAMGGIAVAKISGRLWTAIKQSQSATVFLPECDFTRFVKNGVNPYGSWKWAMENIPDFRKRVENMTYGDVKLRQYLDELEKWHDWTKTISKIGMAPNILVDGITCAVGARSVYETEVNRLTKLGYPKEKAEEKAYYKAVAAYNKTQQSSGGMYLSPMQVDRTYASAALSLFKNANYAYGRMQIEACRGLARTYDFWGGKHKTALIESMTRQIMKEDGLDENTARAIAKATYNRTFRQSIGRLINFATLVPISWALYKVLPYLLTGDDDDKKTDMIEEAVLKGFATSLSDNYVIPFASNILNAGLKVEDGKPTFDPEVFRYQNLYINPATSDLANIYSMVGNQKWYSVANKLGMLGVQSLIGFNPETLGALYQLVSEGDFKGDNTNKEVQIAVLKAISAPEESIRELYMDELGLNNADKDVVKKFMSKVGLDGDDITKVPLSVLEQRYAERQINRDNLLSQIFMSKEDFDGYVEKYKKSFEKKIQDKMDKMDAYDQKKFDAIFDTTTDPTLKGMMEKKRTKDANAAADEQIAKEGLNQEKKGKEPSEEAYDAVKMSIDVAEDNAISTYNKVLNKRYAALNDEYNDQTDAMKYIFMSKHPLFKAYKDLESEYTNYGKKVKELKEKLVSADGYDAKQTILKQIRAERDKFYEQQSKVR